jgi:hypothetical protein
MPRRLSDVQIERVTRELLVRQRRVSVREVMLTLRTQFGSTGRTERICRVLKRLESEGESTRVAEAAIAHEIELLRERVRLAEARAALSEERERQHQDLWAARYAEKVAQLERQSRATGHPRGVTHEQYLRLYRRAAELARRLGKYENPDGPVANERD